MKVKVKVDPDKKKMGEPIKGGMNKQAVHESNVTAKKTPLYYKADEVSKKNMVGAPAPRTGGVAIKKSSGTPSGGTKKMMKASRVRVRKNDASKGAKKSAMKLYR